MDQEVPCLIHPIVKTTPKVIKMKPFDILLTINLFHVLQNTAKAVCNAFMAPRASAF
jgi:hypothetical protein